MEIEVSLHNSMEERAILKEVEQNFMQGMELRGTDPQKRKNGS